MSEQISNIIRQVLYSLKRQYGGPVDVYRLDSTSTNRQTGKKTVVKSVFKIKLAPILPVSLSRQISQSISQISANKAFVQPAAGYVRGMRNFILDRKDLPLGFDLENDDWLVYKNRRYDIKTIQDFEFDAGYIVTGVEIRDVRPEQIFLMFADDLLRPTQTLVET